MLVYGDLKSAQLENLASDPTGVTGRVYFNTATSLTKVYDGTSWVNMASGAPDASPTVSGIVNTTTQSFGGAKTFVDRLNTSDSLGVGFSSAMSGDLPNGWDTSDYTRIVAEAFSGYDTGLTLITSNGGTAHLWYDRSADYKLRIDNDKDSAAADIMFRTRTAGTPVEAMTIGGDGNIDMGYALTVDGNIATEGNINIGNDTSGSSHLFIKGNTTGYVNASVVLEEHNSATRSTGMFCLNSPGNDEWFVGLDYTTANNLAFIYTAQSSHSSAMVSTGSKYMFLTPAGCLSIGKTTPTASKLHVEGTGTTVRLTSTNSIAEVVTGSGTEAAMFARSDVGPTSSGYYKIVAFSANNYAGDAIIQFSPTGNAAQFAAYSDERLKENIADFDTLEDLCSLDVKQFNFKANSSEVIEHGFIAQQAIDYYPQIVDEGGDADEETPEDNPWRIRYGQMVPYLTRAIQELNAKVVAQQVEIDALKAE